MLHLFFGAIGDEFGAMAFARLKIAEQKLGPHHDEEGARCDSGGVPVAWEFGPHLLADSRRLVEEAEEASAPTS